MRWDRVLISAAAGAVLVAVARSQGPDIVLRDCIVTDKEAYVALPAEVIAGPRIERVTPSPDGSYVLIQRTVTPPIRSVNALIDPEAGPRRYESQLLLWSTASRRAVTIWREAGDEAKMPHVQFAEWIPKTNVALIAVGVLPTGAAPDATPYHLLRVDAVSGGVRTVAAFDPNWDSLLVSPGVPSAALVAKARETVRVLTQEGDFGRAVKIAQPGVRWISWMPDGKALFGVRRDAAVAGQEPKARRYLLDPASGNVVAAPEGKLPGYEDVIDLAASLPFRVGSDSVTLADDAAGVQVHPLWLVGATPEAKGRVLIAPDGEQAITLPEAILYQHRGILYASPLLHMNKAQFLTARRTALKRKTMENAKQIGLAMAMYAQDYDENFPPPGEGIRDMVQPYLKNRDAFNNPDTGKFGLSLSYKQIGLAGYESPATSILGYLTGPDGRAVIYVDGHVTWEGSPSP